MTLASFTHDTERLPWLTDDSQPAKTASVRPLVVWGGLAALLIAGASYWIGRTADDGRTAAEVASPVAATNSTTMELPAPRAAPAPEVRPVPVPEVRDAAPAPPITLPEAEPVTASDKPAARQRTAVAEPRRRAPTRQTARKQSAPAAKTPARDDDGYWSSWQSEGASGRMVRIGTYRTRHEAKVAWRKLMKVYPGMRRMSAVTIDLPSARNGRTYYRLQFGTSSQAHSAVLCQRMRTIGQSCVVVGRPATAG